MVLSSSSVQANSKSSVLDFYKEYPKISAGVTIVGVALIALALTAFFTPACWQGGVFPSLATRVASLVVLSTIGVVAISSPFMYGVCVRCIRTNPESQTP